MRLPRALFRAWSVIRSIPSWLDRGIGRVGAVGFEAFAWPLVIGMGLGLGVLELENPVFSRGILKRHASMDATRLGFHAVVAGILAVLVLSLALAFVWRRFRRDPRPFLAVYLDVLRRGAVVAAMPVAVVLKEPIETLRGTLVLAFASVVAILATYSTYHWVSADPSEKAESKRARTASAVVLGAVMAAYAAATAYLSIANHLSFNTGRADLGFYMNIFRQSSQGIFLGCSLCGGSHTTGHFDPILMPLSLVYWIYPFAETLLVLQSLWLASGALPVYLLARHHVDHRGVALALAAAYLLYPALHGVNLFDFHSVALCIPLFVWLLYFLERGRTVAYYVTLALLLLVREDISVALICVGIFCIFSGEDRARIGWTTILASVLYFLVAKLGFMGRADPLNTVSAPGGAISRGGYAYYYEELIPPGHSTLALLETIVGDAMYALGRVLTDEKVDYVAKLFVPLLGLPLLGRGKILLTYGAALTLLATRTYVPSVHFQYSSLLIPFVFFLAISALGRVRRSELRFGNLDPSRLTKALGAGVFAASTLCSWKFGGLVGNETFRAGFLPLSRTPTADNLKMDHWLRQLARSFPKNARVAANTHLLTHLGIVTNLYMLDEGLDVDYVVAGMGNRSVAKVVLAEQARGQLAPVDQFMGIRVFRATHIRRPRLRGPPPKPLEND